MSLQSLLEVLVENEQFKNINGQLDRPKSKQAVFGLVGSLKSFWWSALALAGEKQFLIITQDELSAKGIVKDLTFFTKEDHVLLFPGQEFLPYQVYARSREGTSQRLRTLTRLTQGKPLFVVATAEAFCQKLMPNGVFKHSLMKLVTGQQLDREDLARKLVELGYERVELVEAPGQFAIRGSLVDIFPPSNEKPLRVDFFDDEIDSLRIFDEENQRTIEMIREAVISPAEETLLPKGDLAEVLAELKTRWQSTVKRLERLKKRASIQELNSKMEKLLNDLEFYLLLRKEVIQPHLPIRLPCYDFTPITRPTFGGSLLKG
jgi:transcription-repair coupling factor (superfamily II helicase)